MNWYSWDKEVLILNLHLQPNASIDEWVGLHGERLKLRIRAAPVDGKANAQLQTFLAQEFAVNKKACQILSGETGRQKRVAIQAPQRLPSLPGGLKLTHPC